MKSFKYLIATVAALVMVAVSSQGQVGTTNLPPAPTTTGDPAPTPLGQLEQVGINLWQGVTTLSNVTAVTGGEYSLGAKEFGGYIFVTDWASQYAGVGIGMEYIGAFYGVNANVTLQLPTQPFQKLTWLPTWAQQVSVTPNAIAAIETPLAGGGNSNGGLGSLTGGGASIGFVSWQRMFGYIKLPGSIGGGYDYLNRTGSGRFDGGNHFGYIWITIK